MLLRVINKNNCFINMTNDEFTFIIYSLLTRWLYSRCERSHLMNVICCKLQIILLRLEISCGKILWRIFALLNIRG